MDIIKNPTEMAKRGEEIYGEKYKAAYEEKHLGKYLAIDVNSEHAYLGETAEQALETAKREAPKGVFHLIRIGYSGAFRVSYSSNANRDWLYR